ncbi:hypothetical protein KY306_02125 [Candidatus Woesearchaeota archaeon]|nr:hypothetical protein [Candidatus Woesearchaeota archaeon]
MTKLIEKIFGKAAPYAIAAYFALAPVAKADDPVKPETQPTVAVQKETKPSLDIWLENFSAIDTDGPDVHIQRLEVGDDLFRADHTITDDDYEGWRLGGRQKVTIGDLISGKAGIFVSMDNASNYGLGAEFNGTIAELVQTGFSLERDTGTDSKLFQVYAGASPTENSNVKIGYFLKDGVSHLQGVGWLNLKDSRILAALGGQVSEEGKGKINACIAHYGPKKGEGIGFRIWGQTDFDGNYHVDALLTLGDRNGAGAHKGLMDLFDNGVNDPGVADNIANFRPSPLYTKGSDAVLRIRASHAKDGTVTYHGEVYGRTNELLGKDVNVTGGVGWTRTELSGQTAQDIYSAFIGADIGPVTIEAGVEGGKGRKPSGFGYIAASLNSILDYFRKDEKK